MEFQLNFIKYRGYTSTPCTSNWQISHLFIKNKEYSPELVFSQTFLKCQQIEKCYAYKTNTVKKYNSKWNLFK